MNQPDPTAHRAEGFHANVLRLLPVANRVQLPLELPGSTMPVEVACEYVIPQKSVSQLPAGPQALAMHA